MIVKICANKSIDEAKFCLDAGADIIGILVGQEHASTDFVNKDTARSICNFINHRCDVSLVTHLTDANEIIALSKYIGNNIIQLHSNISEEEVEKIVNALPDIKLVRLIHISTDGNIITDLNKIKFADFYLLDSFNLKTNQVGGTGLTHDWKKSAELIKRLNKPTFLAGGLTPENVSDAIKIVQPYGVDVNSGCKVNGKKDAEKVRQFVINAKCKKVKGIIFDFDSTLYSGCVWGEWGKYINKYFHEIFPNNADDLMKKYDIKDTSTGFVIATITHKELGSTKPFYEYQNNNIFQHDLSDFVYVNIERLRRLSELYDIFLVSNSSPNYLDYYLDLFKIDKDMFKLRLTNPFDINDLTKTGCYKKVLDTYHLSPNEVLVVGDSYSADIVPAINMNMQARHITHVNETNQIIEDLIILKENI